MKTCLFIIDMQNDFCRPYSNLYIPDAEIDAGRIARLIASCAKDIDGIILAQDIHQVMNITHTVFWTDLGGRHPKPGTPIKAEEVEKGEWIPFTEKERVLNYLRHFEKETKEFHVVWLEHCIVGSEGAAVVSRVMREVRAWAARGHFIHIVEKGAYPFAEQYGAFRAEVIVEDAPSTWFNLPLLQELNTYDSIWMAGEARTHCVAATIRQLLDFPAIMQKIVILKDCMSDVPGNYPQAEAVFQKARAMGAHFTTSVELRQGRGKTKRK